MKRFHWVIITVVLIVVSSMLPLAFTEAAQAGVAEWNLQDLTNGADSIIVGTVLERSSYWNNDEHARIFTSVTLQVGEGLKGSVNQDRITVTSPGGEVDEIGQWVSDMPSFNQGEEVVIFLKRLSKAQLPNVNDSKIRLSEEQFEVYGGFRGKFIIKGDKVGDLPVAKFKERVNKVLEGQPLPDEELDVPLFHAMFPYSYAGYSWPHPPPPVVKYRINENCGDCTGEGAAVQAAAATWNAAGADFSFSYARTTTVTDVSSWDGVNEILWRNMGDVTEVAVATVWYIVDTKTIVECDMEFNDYYTFSTAAIPLSNRFDVESVALHEFGHYLHLGDLYNAADSSKVMYGYSEPGTTKRALHPDDIAGIKYIYGASVTPPPTVTAPAVTNYIGASNVTQTSAKLNGKVTSTGDENPNVHIYWGTTDGGTNSGNWAHDENLGIWVGTGPFYKDIASLSASTTYYYRCYAQNSGGGSWADSTTSFTTLGVSQMPAIGYSPNSLNFSSVKGGTNPAYQALEVWNSGTDTLPWSVADNATWLGLSPPNGNSTGEHDTVTVSVNISGMSPGHYQAIITISASGASNTPQTVPVYLTIGQPAAEIAWVFPATSDAFLAPTPANNRPYLTSSVGLPTGTEPAQLLGVYRLDESTGEWKYFIPAFTMNTLNSLEPGEAYLVTVSGACSWLLPQE